MTVSKFLSSTGTERLSHEDIRLLRKWNAVCPSPENICVHHLVHKVCLNRPQGIAISAPDGEWTYAEVDSLSSTLARQLIGYGVRASVFVPICIEKSRWAVIGMLAVLKAGGAFLMLDPSHPPDRLRTVCQDISAALVLTSSSYVQLATTLVETALVISEKVTVDGCDSQVDVATLPQSPMYAVFTSGSTGKPKGAVVSHSAFASMAIKILPLVGLSSESRVLQFSSNSFDGIVLDYFLTLLAEGCVCVPSESDSKNRLSASIARLNINWAFLTPSVARILSPEQIPSLRHLALGGEALAQSDLDLWSAHVQLIELYGPAECAALSTIQPDLAKANSPANIGHPIAVNGWVVDPHDHNTLLPIGEEGELLLEGPGLGDGYMNQPQQTAAAYVEAPQWLAVDRRNLPGSGRMYKTGDLVCLNPDGTFQYRGRKGTQVKLRGQRIELGEIESLARECCPVSRDVVAEVIWRNHGQSMELILFLYCPQDMAVHEGSSESETLFEKPTALFQDQAKRLLSHLRERLPRYMVPEHVLPITHIPMTKTGKTDRLLLREEAVLALQQFYKAPGSGPSSNCSPTTDTEKKLQVLCARILKVPQENVGLGDNWFSMGGNSILTMQLVASAAEENLLFTVQDIFRHPVLTDLAGVIRHGSVLGGAVEPFALISEDALLRQAIIRKIVDKYYPDSPENVEDVYPCTTNQVQCIQLSVAKDANLTLHIDTDPISGSLDPDRFAWAWKTVVEAHPILRTQIVEVDRDSYFQAVRKECIPIDCASSWPSTDTDVWGLGKPLIRLVRKEGRFLILFHHVLHDGFSLSLVLSHLEQAYRGDTLQLQPFSPFIQSTLNIDAQVDEFWRSRFAGWRPRVFPKLPHPGYKPKGACYLGKSLPIPKNQRDGFTTDTRLRLALGLALARATGDRDVVFGAHVNRRDVPLPAITQITGPTIGTLPLRLQFKSPEQTLRDQLKEIQNQMVETIPFQCAELDYIKRLSPEAASACEFQTSLMIQPDLGDMKPFLFAQCRYHEAEFACWSLGFVAEAQPTSLKLYAFYDEQMVEASQVQSMLDLMATVLELIEQAPNSQIGNLFKI